MYVHWAGEGMLRSPRTPCRRPRQAAAAGLSFGSSPTACIAPPSSPRGDGGAGPLAVVVGAVPCRAASLLAGHSRLDRAGGRGVTRQGRSASVAAEHRLGAPPDGVIAVCHDIASAPRRVFRTALSRSLSVHTVPRRMPVLPVTTTPSRLLDGDSQGLEA